MKSGLAIGDAAGEAPAAVPAAARHRPSALHDFERLAARARRGARPLDPDADDEIVAGHALDLLPRPLDDILLARGAHRRAHVLAALHRRRAVAPELRVLGDQLCE